ncbi:hypothetical protein DV737_g4594, partial [Chaetothyriales sp. CBS 132003]
MAAVAADLPPPVVPGVVPAAAAPVQVYDKEPEVPKINVAEYVGRSRFHQRLTLPATDSHGELTVSYAVGGCQDTSAPTVLLVGGLFGGRYMAVMADYICEKMGIRIVVTDRPGMGHSTPAPVTQRMAVWLETVPVLLEAIGTTQVALAAHSCGVIYAFNTLYTMPHILRPQSRALYLFAPYVPPTHSGVQMLSAASMIPSSVIGHFHSVISFANNHVVEPIGFSSTILTGISKKTTSLFSAKEERQRQKAQEDSNRGNLNGRLRKYTGCNDAKELMALNNEISRRVFAEHTSGANDEALVCLRKPGAGPWGVCDSYKGFAEKLDERLRGELWTDNDSKGIKVTIRAFWAEKDALVGKGGEKYLNACFRPFTEETKDDAAACLVYRQELWSHTEHDSIVYPHMLALPAALEDMLGTNSQDLTFYEIPAGMIDDAGTFAGAAANELREETGLIVPEHELRDLTKLALKDAKSSERHLQNAVYPSPGGCDEYIALFFWEKTMSRIELNELRDRIPAKTLFQIAEERRAQLQDGINRKNGGGSSSQQPPLDLSSKNVVNVKINPDGTIQQQRGSASSSNDDDNDDAALSPIWDTLLLSTSLSAAHFTLSVLTMHQYAEALVFGPLVQSTLFIAFPFLTLTIHLFHGHLFPRSITDAYENASLATQSLLYALRQTVLLVIANVAGCHLIYLCNDRGYYAVMKDAPNVGTVWVCCVIEMGIAGAALGVLGPAAWAQWKGYELF